MKIRNNFKKFTGKIERKKFNGNSLHHDLELDINLNNNLNVSCNACRYKDFFIWPNKSKPKKGNNLNFMRNISKSQNPKRIILR